MAYLCVIIQIKESTMIDIINNAIPEQVKELVKEITETQGGQWVEKKELRVSEAEKLENKEFNPKTARTRSFEN